MKLQGLCVTALLLGVLAMGCTSDEPMNAPNSVADPSLTFIKMPATVGLNRLVAAVDTITVTRGGKLKIDYEERDTTNGKKIFSLKVELKFDDRSVTNDFVAGLSMDAQYLMSNVGLTFGPHGTNFLQPAKLKIDVKGLDLTGYNDDDPIYLYYDNNGTWERMPGEVKIKVREGQLKCDNGRIPHFSRYAFGF